MRHFAPHSHFYGIVHVDTDNINIHLEIANRDRINGNAITWDKPTIRRMIAMRWAPPGGGGIPGAPPLPEFHAGAGTFVQRQSFAHPARSIDLLVDVISGNPSAEVKRLDRERQVTWYHTKSGHLGLVYGGHRHTIAGLNFALRARGFSFGLTEDLQPRSLDRDERGVIAKQNHHDFCMGVGHMPLNDYDKIMDNPLLVQAPETRRQVRDFVEYGITPTDRVGFELLARVLNSHLKRKLLYKAKEWYGPNKDQVGWLYRLDMPNPPMVSHSCLRMVRRFSEEISPRVRDKTFLDGWLGWLEQLLFQPQRAFGISLSF